MQLINDIRYLFRYIGIPKEQRLDYYLQKLVSKETGFNVDKIKILVAEKTNMEKYNQFNKFIFKYKRKKYQLLDSLLVELK
ncbi:MAG: hypothetical protein ACI4U0_06910 [Candidatus Aphodocola sp.]